MNKVVSPIAVQALKEALCNIYWYKKELRSFLANCLSDRSILNITGWGGDNYKRQIVSDIVDYLCADQEKYLGDIRRLFHEASKMDSFRHLEQLENGQEKAKKARDAVKELVRIIQIHDDVTAEEKGRENRRKKEAEVISQNVAVDEKLDEIKNNFTKLIISNDPHGRGYSLETIMFDLFNLFDLDPKAAFKISGEQIDGAFTLEGTEYLFEARWRKEPAGLSDLDTFAGKVKRKLDNTLGLFLSINGYPPTAVTQHSMGRPVLILMSGEDLMAVLDKRIDFVTLLNRKKVTLQKLETFFCLYKKY